MNFADKLRMEGKKLLEELSIAHQEIGHLHHAEGSGYPEGRMGRDRSPMSGRHRQEDGAGCRCTLNA